MSIRPHPNVFLVGAAKAGTTSLANWMATLPGVFVPGMKEPHYLARVEPDANQQAYVSACRTEADYSNLYSDALPYRWRLDASPSYLWSDIAASNIRDVCSDAKIIISLREPVSRCYSHYLMDLRYGLQRRPFFDAVRSDYEQASGSKGWGRSHLYVELGDYHRQVERYLAAFPHHQMLIISQDDLAQNEGTVRRAICDFLSIERSSATRGAIERDYGYGAARSKISHALLGSTIFRRAGAKIPSKLKAQIRDRMLFRKAAKPPLDPRAEAWLGEIYRIGTKSTGELIRDSGVNSVIDAAEWLHG